MIYTDLVAHYTQGLSGRQRIEVIECELDEIRLVLKWTKTCESFLNFADNKFKDHQGLVPDPAQYPESWYINRLNHTIELHVMLYQYVVNHQMQADSIAKHLGTASVTSLSYKSYIETIRTICQTIVHTNNKYVQESLATKHFKPSSTVVAMATRVVGVVAVAATLGEGVDVNLTKLVVANGNTTIGSLKTNLII